MVRPVLDHNMQRLRQVGGGRPGFLRADGLAGLYAGTPEEAWSAAADLSQALHIVTKDRPYHTVVSCAPRIYDELWVGGKCAYKLEPVVADGGRLILYAPHIHELSVTHGEQIRRVGYHVRDYFSRTGSATETNPGASWLMPRT